MVVALTRPVSPRLAECELTHLARSAIDADRAIVQHAAYEAVLRSLGADVVQVAAAPDLADSVFIEDTAIVLDEIAVITRPGAESRRTEPVAVAVAVAQYRELVTLDAPATLDGGDVIRVGRTLYVGRSSRTNDAGIAQLRRAVSPHGYEVRATDFRGCLHLKSAATAIADDLVLLNSAWVSPAQFADVGVLHVNVGEPFAANALRVGDRLVYSSEYPRTRELFDALRLEVATVDLSELAKAEGAVTCCSLVFEA